MILSKKKKFICLNPPKTGSGFREKILAAKYADFSVLTHKEKYWGCRHFDVSETEGYLKNNNLKADDYFWFSFVRNPWYRLVSWYCMDANREIETKKTPKDKLFSKYYFAKWLKKCLQSSYTLQQYTVRNGVEIDFVGRLESLESDLLLVADELGLNFGDISKISRGQGRYKSHHNRIMSLWSQELVDIVANREKFIIDRFNYNFDPQKTW